MVPKGSNSGIYLMGEYEVQILDSYGKADDKLDAGRPGGTVQRRRAEEERREEAGRVAEVRHRFQAPKFDGRQEDGNAKFVKVTLNDMVMHENVEMKGPTPGGLTGKEAATGPLMFQGDHGPVAFRNIKSRRCKK